MAGNEGRTAVTAARMGRGPSEWGKVRRLVATLLVAFSMVGAMSVVFAGTTSAQSDAVLQWLPEIQSASAATGVPAEYIAAVIRVESGGDPNAVSVAGAMGLMQVMSYEFESQGISQDLWFDPATNIMAGSTEIGKFLSATGSIEQALASYFGTGCDATGTCTDGYISTILSYAAAYAAAIGSGSTTVDTSGVTSGTGTGTTTDDGSWQGNVPATGDDGWQGGAPSEGGWQGDPPQAGSGDGNLDGSNGNDDTSGDSTGNSTPDDGSGSTGDDVIVDDGAANG